MDSPETQTIVPVQEIMQRDVRTTTPERRIAEVAQLLIDENLTGIPVVDASGVLVGVITEYDIVSKRGELVGDIMSRGVVTVTDDTSAARVVELVGLHGIRGIPVLHDGALVGLITRADLVRLFLTLRWRCSACEHEERGVSMPRSCSSCGGSSFTLIRE
jgi:CBS domain-containing protein